jgi:hypothetical protein
MRQHRIVETFLLIPWSLGLTFTPTALPTLAGSVDYYHIRLKGGIGTARGRFVRCRLSRAELPVHLGRYNACNAQGTQDPEWTAWVSVLVYGLGSRQRELSRTEFLISGTDGAQIVVDAAQSHVP